jgi:spastin
LLDNNSKLTSKELRDVVKATDGYSGSDLSNLCKEAALDSVRGLSDKELKSGKTFHIGKKNFENALRAIRPSVQKNSIEFYLRWNEEFGVR